MRPSAVFGIGPDSSWLKKGVRRGPESVLPAGPAADGYFGALKSGASFGKTDFLNSF
jgi:hypothetical protein